MNCIGDGDLLVGLITGTGIGIICRIVWEMIWYKPLQNKTEQQLTNSEGKE